MRMKKRNAVFAMFLAVVMLLSLTSCGSSDDDGTTEGGYKDTITVAHWSEPTTLDPQATGAMACGAVWMQIFDTLIELDENLEPVPCLAESWEQIDDYTFRFYLREGVTFHNGDPLTAEDVAYTIARGCADPGSSATYINFDPENTRAIDELTVEIKLKNPEASIFETLSSLRGGIVCKRAVEKMGDDAFGRAPVGTGPYKFEEWQTGTEIRLSAYEDYWNGTALTPNLVYRIITESATRVVEMETGGADICLNILASEYDRISNTEGIHVEMGPGYQYSLITFNMQDPVLSDIRLREALVYAIDRESIVQAVYGETATVANGIMPTNVLGSKTYDDDLYDVERAQELLAEAGYEDGLTINFVVQPLEEMQRITEAVQNMWRQIGVETEVTTAEVSSYLAQGYTLQVGIRNGSAPDPAGNLIIYESSFGDRLNSNNDELDAMLAHARTLYDQEERIAAYNDICDYLWEAHWSIPVAFKSTIYAVSDKVEGFEFNAMNYLKMENIAVAN